MSMRRSESLRRLADWSDDNAAGRERAGQWDLAAAWRRQAAGYRQDADNAARFERPLDEREECQDR